MATLSRRTRTEETRQATEQALLEATIALLDEGSAFADLGIEQIVRRAGFSRPTFYKYFRDKRELILRLGATLERDLVAAAEPWLSFADVSLRDTLAGVLEAFRQNKATVGAIIEAATYDPEVLAFWQRFHDRFLPDAQRRIAAGDPGLGDAAVAARAYALVWMTERTLTEHLARPSVDEAALIDQLAWLWQKAAGAQPRRP